MRIQYLMAAFALLCASLSLSSATERFEWKYVGGDPYRCSTCTPQRACEISRIPQFVCNRVLQAFEAEKDGTKDREVVYISQGDTFRSVTFGMKKPGVKFNVTLVAEGNFPANIYRVSNGAVDWTVYHVRACGNWATKVTSAVLPMAKPAPASPNEVPTVLKKHSTVVQFTCPDKRGDKS